MLLVRIIEATFYKELHQILKIKQILSNIEWQLIKNVKIKSENIWKMNAMLFEKSILLLHFFKFYLNISEIIIERLSKILPCINQWLEISDKDEQNLILEELRCCCQNSSSCSANISGCFRVCFTTLQNYKKKLFNKIDLV